MRLWHQKLSSGVGTFSVIQEAGSVFVHGHAGAQLTQAWAVAPDVLFPFSRAAGSQLRFLLHTFTFIGSI